MSTHSDPVHFPSSPHSRHHLHTRPHLGLPLPKSAVSRTQSLRAHLSHCHPPPMFHNSSVLPLHPEYNNDDITLKPKLRVSARESGQNLRRSFHLTQLQRSSLHLEKCLIKQKIEEHEISIQALKERMVDVENSIASTTHAFGSLHCYMDQVSVPIPDMAEHVAASTMFSEDGDDDDARGQSSVDAHRANERRHRPARRTSTGIVSGKVDLQARISTHGQQTELEGH
ncbi:hypothetical protein EDB84DRAFT_1533030 [Lactarius hengduanensis]|nr:hypothetical protein EDB84DRAFT_1533030 [Lactarius hengduanensis]